MNIRVLFPRTDSQFHSDSRRCRVSPLPYIKETYVPAHFNTFHLSTRWLQTQGRIYSRAMHICTLQRRIKHTPAQIPALSAQRSRGCEGVKRLIGWKCASHRLPSAALSRLACYGDSFNVAAMHRLLHYVGLECCTLLLLLLSYFSPLSPSLHLGGFDRHEVARR